METNNIHCPFCFSYIFVSLEIKSKTIHYKEHMKPLLFDIFFCSLCDGYFHTLHTRQAADDKIAATKRLIAEKLSNNSLEDVLMAKKLKKVKKLSTLEKVKKVLLIPIELLKKLFK